MCFSGPLCFDALSKHPVPPNLPSTNLAGLSWLENDAVIQNHRQALILTFIQERLQHPSAQLTACEAAVRHLESAYMRHVLPDAWTGAEWWIQVLSLLASTVQTQLCAESLS